MSPSGKMSTARRRVPESLQPGQSENAAGDKSTEGSVHHVRYGGKAHEEPGRAEESHPLVRRGLELYERAEQDGFRNGDTLRDSLRYFVQAAEGGSEEALDWIGSFLDALSGLPRAAVDTADNLKSHLEWLQSSSETERQVRVVAKVMFSKMADSDGLVRRSRFDECSRALLEAGTAEGAHSPEMVKSSSQIQGAVKDLLHSAILQSGVEVVTEESFCRAAVTYAKGRLIAPHEATGLSPEKLAQFRSANIVKMVVEFPLETVRFVRRSSLRMIERRGVKWLWSSLPTKQLYLLLFAYLLPLIEPVFILASIASVVFFGAFLAMAIATLQIIINAEKIHSFMEYSSVFQYFSLHGMKINTRKPESELVRHSTGPYFTFVGALLLMVGSISLSHDRLILHEVLCVVAAVLAVVVFFQFHLYGSPLVVVSMSTRLLGWLNVFLLLANAWLPIPEAFFFVGKQIFSVPFFGFSLGINITTLLTLPVQLLLAVYLVVRKTWRNFYDGLGPYCLFVCWSVLCRNFLARSNVGRLVATFAGITLLVPLLPLLPVLMLGSPLVFLLYFGISRQFVVSLVVVGVLSVLVFVAGFNYHQVKEAKWLRIPFEYVILLLVVSTGVVMLIAANVYASWHTPPPLPAVSVAEYTAYCGRGNWEGGNTVQTQLNCLHLRGRLFEGLAAVDSVKLAQVTNDYEVTLRSLPSAVRTTLTCLFGSSAEKCGNRAGMTMCTFSGCHWHESDTYQFAVSATLQLADNETVSVTLVASEILRPVVIVLRAGDAIRFNASFLEGMGSEHMTFQLLTLAFEGNVYGRSSDEEEIEKQKDYLLNKIVSSFKNAICLLMEVLVGYTHTDFYQV